MSSSEIRLGVAPKQRKFDMVRLVIRIGDDFLPEDNPHPDSEVDHGWPRPIKIALA
jgi:hypothetical protein